MGRWVGITVASGKLTLVDAEVDASVPIVVYADLTWKLQTGDRSNAYNVMYRQLTDYLKENSAERVVIKGSAISMGGTKKAHLEAAELRGVVMSAAASVVPVDVLTKSSISRGFGKRNVNDYLSDDEFWSSEAEGEVLRSGSREAALLIIAARS